MHDIYDPPPALEQEWTPPRREPLLFTTGDLMCLVGLCAVLFGASVRRGCATELWAWLAKIATAGGRRLLVILESWLISCAEASLHRCRPLGLKARAVDDLSGRRAGAVALVGLGVAVTLMLSLSSGSRTLSDEWL